MDPEQIYQEVLAEEQQKGSAAPVAEGRAKAARQRAIEGSPHPKEPKWWPGSQPHFEGDGEAEEEPAEEAPAEEAAEAPAAEEPAEQPAAEAPAEQPAAETPAEQPAAQAPADQAAAAPAAQPAAAAVAVQEPAADAPREQVAQSAVLGGTAPAEIAAPDRPMGVTHGTPSGNRLRPEDAVASDAQFAGEEAMKARRKLIDDLVATGVPAVSASGSERSSPMLVFAYLAIIVMAVGFLISQRDSLAGGEGNGEAPAPAEAGSATTIVAKAVAFESDTLSAPAGEETTFTLDNQDTVPHNLSFYESEGGPELAKGDTVKGGAKAEVTVPGQQPGTYFFRCDLHPTGMTGDFVVE